MPPEALGIESMRLGLGAGTTHHPPLLFVCVLFVAT
jgi:hypothetical protein